MDYKIVMAIDPGCEETAFVIWDSEQKIMLNKHKLPNKELLLKLKSILEGGIVQIVGIETISSYSMAVGQTTFDSAIWTGIFKQKIESLGYNVKLIFRQSIKMHHALAISGVNDTVLNNILKRKYGEDNTVKRPNRIYWNEEVEKRGGSKYMNGDMYAAFALATFLTEPNESLIRNPAEREENKLSKSLQ